MHSSTVVAIAIAGLLAGCRSSRDGTPATRAPVTLAILNAAVWTGDTARPSAEAIALSGERIVLVGTSAEVRAIAGDTRVIDAIGRLVVPGFIDTHVHFIDGGFRLASVQLRDAASRDEFVRRIGAFAASLPKGT
jgi:predicted amidohydrolase YtcJ